MLSRLSFGKLLGPALLATFIGAVAIGSGACEDPNVNCDEFGNCQVCDGYGCHPANTSTTGARSRAIAVVMPAIAALAAA